MSVDSRPSLTSTSFAMHHKLSSNVM
jgi:hypothetical protein